MDLNTILLGAGGAGGGGILIALAKFMLNNARDIIKSVDQMRTGLDDIKESVADLKSDVRDQIKDVKTDVAQLRDHIHENEMSRRSK